jgi:hypothetical protein
VPLDGLQLVKKLSAIVRDEGSSPYSQKYASDSCSEPVQSTPVHNLTLSSNAGLALLSDGEVVVYRLQLSCSDCTA